MFVTLEGVEGSGKTALSRTLVARLRERGQSVLLTREPGGSPIGPPLRSLLLSESYAVTARAELLLYAAERAEHVERVIRPALVRGEWVLCDRFGDATRAYQAFGRGLPRAEVESVHAIACGGLEPDLTLYLRVPVEMGLARARRRDGETGLGEGRFEAEDMAFHHRVAAGYEALASEFPSRILSVDGTGRPGEVADTAWTLLEDRLVR